MRDEDTFIDVSDEPVFPKRDPGEGILPGLDMQLGDDPRISGGDDLARIDEENLYGNDTPQVNPEQDDQGHEVLNDDEKYDTDVNRAPVDELISNTDQ